MAVISAAPLPLVSHWGRLPPVGHSTVVSVCVVFNCSRFNGLHATGFDYFIFFVDDPRHSLKTLHTVATTGWTPVPGGRRSLGGVPLIVWAFRGPSESFAVQTLSGVHGLGFVAVGVFRHHYYECVRCVGRPTLCFVCAQLIKAINKGSSVVVRCMGRGSASSCYTWAPVSSFPCCSPRYILEWRFGL